MSYGSLSRCTFPSFSVHTWLHLSSPQYRAQLLQFVPTRTHHLSRISMDGRSACCTLDVAAWSRLAAGFTPLFVFALCYPTTELHYRCPAAYHPVHSLTVLSPSSLPLTRIIVVLLILCPTMSTAPGSCLSFISSIHPPRSHFFTSSYSCHSRPTLYLRISYLVYISLLRLELIFTSHYIPMYPPAVRLI